MIETIISAAGLVYTIGKDAWSYVKENYPKKEADYKETSRIVELNYPKESGIEEAWKKKGYELRWAAPQKIESHKLKGYEILYEIDESKKEIFSLKCWNNDSGRPADLTLMAKKTNP